tara:strand:- start:409 stop:870 length:462 start_codon:yes stop_codon:yes gene_type:complete
MTSQGIKMKKSELKQLIKPIVEECIKDALLTSGLLTSVISEVVAGVQKGLVTEQMKVPIQEEKKEQKNTISEDERQKIVQNKKKLLDAIGTSSYNGVDVFEGTKPLKKGGSTSNSSGGYKAFEGVDPNDPGVNIDKLTKNLGGVWKKLAEGKK